MVGDGNHAVAAWRPHRRATIASILHRPLASDSRLEYPPPRYFDGNGTSQGMVIQQSSEVEQCVHAPLAGQKLTVPLPHRRRYPHILQTPACGIDQWAQPHGTRARKGG